MKRVPYFPTDQTRPLREGPDMDATGKAIIGLRQVCSRPTGNQSMHGASRKIGGNYMMTKEAS
jgi:hypothetical protein